MKHSLPVVVVVVVAVVVDTVVVVEPMIKWNTRTFEQKNWNSLIILENMTASIAAINAHEIAMTKITSRNLNNFVA
jgi:hypothetical protein